MKEIFKPALLLSLVAIVAISCNDDDCTDPESRRIILSSRVTMEVSQRLQDRFIENGQRLSLFITPYNDLSEILYSNVNLISDGTGNLTSQTPMYYPIDGRTIDFYGIHPYVASATLPNPLTFSIQQDQTAVANYLNSDLLHATRFNQARTTDAVSLLFSHKLAKVDFTIVNNEGLDLNELNAVNLLNMRPTTTVNVMTGAITAATGTPGDVRAYGINTAPEQPGQRVSVDDIHAIVVPQTIPSGTQLFRITVGTQSYLYTTDADFEFQGGYQHHITLTIVAGTISISAEISPWLDGGSIGGEVTPE